MKATPLVLLLALVLLLHWSGLSWLGAQIQSSAPLARMSEPMFTRVIQATAVIEPAPTVLKASPPKPAPKKIPALAAVVPAADNAEASTPTGDSTKPPQAPETPESPVRTAVTEPATPTPTAEANADPSDTWPPDTRLTYRLTGNYRGELRGSARVQWQREAPVPGRTEAVRYQVQLAISLSGVEIASMTSQGKINEAGLLPELYEEKLPGNVRRVTLEGNQIRFNNGRVDVRPTTVQDTASQFVDLSHRFATGVETLKEGAEVRLWLARPGGLDFWTYDVLAPEILQTPELGAIEAFRLKPRPLSSPRGPIVAEMWFAPSLQYLPVRVRISLGDGNFIDLMVERIEQSERPKVNAPKDGQLRDPT